MQGRSWIADHQNCDGLHSCEDLNRGSKVPMLVRLTQDRPMSCVSATVDGSPKPALPVRALVGSALGSL